MRRLRAASGISTFGKNPFHRASMPSGFRYPNFTFSAKRLRDAVSSSPSKFVAAMKIPLKFSIWVSISFTCVTSQLRAAPLRSRIMLSASSRNRIAFFSSASLNILRIAFSVLPT